MSNKQRRQCLSRVPRWLFPTVLLCLYGFFKEFKPSEPFLNPFITHNRSDPNDPGKGFTNAVAEDDIYPYWTYSYLVAVVFALILTDFLVYKPLIIIESLAYLATRVLLVAAFGLWSMRLMELFYGIASATEIAYYSYIYVMIDKKHYKYASSFTRAAVLLGRALSGYLGQALYSTGVLNLLGLHYFSLASVVVACVFALLLPNPPLSLFPCSGSQRCCRNLWNSVVSQLKQAAVDLKRFYFNPHLLKWSLWWAVATCGMLQVANYVQPLWSDIASESSGGSEENHRYYNGLVVATETLVGSGGAFLVSLLKVNWSIWGELVLGIFSVADCAFLFTASATSQLWLAYLCQILFRGSYAFVITIATVEVSTHMKHQNYGLIFGINTAVALILQTVLTVILTDKRGLAAGARTQFKVYSGYYYILAVVFLFSGVYRISKTGCVRSFKLCWGSQLGTHSASVNEDTREPGDATGEGDCYDKPLLSQEEN